MNRRTLIPGILLVAAVIAAYAVAPMLGHDSEEQGYYIRLLPVVEVYKDGKIVYKKVGDPPTQNLAYAFLMQLLPRYDTSSGDVKLTIVKMDGNGYTYNPDGYARDSSGGYRQTMGPHTLWVVAGTGTASPGISDYTLTNTYSGEARLVELSYNNTENSWTLKVSGGIQFDANLTVSEIGLASDFGETNAVITDPAATPSAGILLFRDVLANPIAVGNGDVIQVDYTIKIIFPTA